MSEWWDQMTEHVDAIDAASTASAVALQRIADAVEMLVDELVGDPPASRPRRQLVLVDRDDEP